MEWNDPKPIRGLSLKQPFLNLMCLEEKTLETRTWGTKFRGLILLCASQQPYELQKIQGIMTPDQYDEFRLMQMGPNVDLFYETGYALAVANLVNVRLMIPEDEPKAFVAYYPDLFVWQFKDLRQIKPFEYKGKMGLFSLTEETRAAIEYL